MVWRDTQPIITHEARTFEPDIREGYVICRQCFERLVATPAALKRHVCRPIGRAAQEERRESR
jgi:hypothetical protein